MVSPLQAVEAHAAARERLSPVSLLAWHADSPKKVLRALRSGNEQALWAAWTAHLKKRRRPKSHRQLFQTATQQGSATWAGPAALHGAEPAESAEQAALRNGYLSDRLSVEAAQHWINMAHHLPKLSRSLEPELWWDLLRETIQVVDDAERERVECASLPGQLLRGELPLTLAILFPELNACRQLHEPARAALAQGMEELLDGEGVLHAKEWANYVPLLRCWIRARAIGGSADATWNAASEAQFRHLIQETLRAARPDGQPLFVGADRLDPKLLRAAVRLCDDRKLRKLWKQTRRRTARAAARTSSAEKPLGLAGVTSEWAQSAILRSAWTKDSHRLGVLYPHQRVQLELHQADELVWSGDWDLQVRLNGQAAMPDGEWEEVCWFSDPAVDYLELEIPLAGGWKAQRKMLLARQDEFLYLADAVIGPAAAEINYCSRLPLAAGVHFEPAAETREGILKTKRSRLLVLPLALAEWRSDPRSGALCQTETGLQLRQEAVGQTLFAPLWFDLNPKRNRQPCTWRQLTVAQLREVESRDRAVGFRVQVGTEQWLVYRSFQQPSNRTLLGHNLASESLVGRFTTKGEVQALVEVE
ncbi:MAG TPA: hypothetical protein VFE24_03540 [Pirellulales bacterium]|jgi:hypothetical protein|nr:hypothetical protein [Pirellulales bacterium]